MGLKSKSKGKRGEREIVALARAHDLPAERTWHTAQSADAHPRCCDVLIAGRPAQVKIAANSFQGLYAALDGVEMAFLRSDRREWIVVLRAEDYLRLLSASRVSEVAGRGLRTKRRIKSEQRPALTTRCAEPNTHLLRPWPA